MIRIIVFLWLICHYETAVSQRFVTRNGIARFYSKTELEDIAAENKQVMAIIDPATKSVAVSMLMKGFLFRKELMQDHFNENYVESDKFPKAVFEGNYAEPLDVSADGQTKLSVKGKISLHGISKEIELPAIVEVKDGVLYCKADFQLVPEDFQIKIPNLVRDKISRKIDVFVSFDLKKQ